LQQSQEEKPRHRERSKSRLQDVEPSTKEYMEKHIIKKEKKHKKEKSHKKDKKTKEHEEDPDKSKDSIIVQESSKAKIIEERPRLGSIMIENELHEWANYMGTEMGELNLEEKESPNKDEKDPKLQHAASFVTPIMKEKYRQKSPTNTNSDGSKVISSHRSTQKKSEEQTERRRAVSIGHKAKSMFELAHSKDGETESSNTKKVQHLLQQFI
jgi:hypothetical protein